MTRFGGFELDTERVELRGPEGPVSVEPQVFDVLAYLVDHRDRVVPKEELLDQIWGDRFVSESALTSRLKSARRAVGDDGRRQEVIRTVHGRGYRFVAPISDPVALVTDGGQSGIGETVESDSGEPLPATGAEPAAPAPETASRPVPAPDTDWPLLGRQRELDRLGELFHGGTSGGVLLSGPPGVGKTRLAHECVDLAAAAGWAVARAVGHPEARNVPLACLAHLLPAGVTEAATLDGELARTALFQRAQQALTTRAGGGRLLLMVDDVDQTDQLSRALIAGLVAAGNAFVVLTQRSPTEPVPAIEHLVKDGHVERIDLGPLPDEVLDVLLYRVLAGPIDGASLRQLLGAAEGSPGVLRQLVESSIERGVLVRHDNVWSLSGQLGAASDISSLVENRLADLDEDQRGAAEMLALAGSLDLDTGIEILGEEVLDGLDLHGLLAVDVGDDGTTVRLAHPLFSEVLLAGLGPLRARRHRARLADAIEARSELRPEDELRLVRWRMDAGGAIDPDHLAQAARLALLEGDDTTAAALIDRLKVDDPSPRTIQLEAELQVRRGQMARADDFLASIDLDTLDDIGAVQVLRRRATNLFYGHWRFDDALDLLAANFDRVGESSRLSLQSHWVMLAANMGRAAAAVELGERLLPDATELVRLELLRGLSTGRALTGRLEQALECVEQARLLADEVPPWLARVGHDHAVYNEVNVLMELGRIDDARAVVERETARGVQPGWIPVAAARLAFRVGELDAVDRWLEAPIEVAQSVEHRYVERLLRNMRALAALTRGDLEAACAEAAVVEEIVDEIYGVVRLDMLDVLSAVQAATGDIDGAVERLESGVAEARDLGIVLVEQFQLVRLAALRPTAETVERLEELAGLIDGDLAELRALQARTTLEGGDLEPIAAEYERRGYMSAARRIRDRG